MASWSQITRLAVLLVLTVLPFSGTSAQAEGRTRPDHVRVWASSEREIGVVGTVDCGRRSGLRCELGPAWLLTVWTDDFSGHRERITIDVSWIVSQLDAYDQDDLVCLNVRSTDDGTVQAVGLSTPCGAPPPVKRTPVKDDQKVDQAPASTRTPTPTATVTPTATAVPIINLSLTKSGVIGVCGGAGCTTVWTITVTNSGPNIAHNVVVIDRPEAELTTVTTAVLSQGSYNTGTNRWTIGTIGVGPGNQQTAVITFAASDGSLMTGGYTNEAEVESASETDSNSTPNNDNPAEDDQDSDFVLEPD